MATATAKKTAEPLDIQGLVEPVINLISAEESTQLKTLDHLSGYYIRKSPSQESVNKKMDDLIPDRDDNLRVVEVQKPFLIWINPETGEKFIVDGNTRFRAYHLMRNNTAYKDCHFLPIPTQRLLVPPTAENLIRLQISSNDQVEPHDVLQLADAAVTYKEERKQYWLDQGKDGKQAGKLSTDDTLALFGNKFGASYLTRLKNVNNAPEWVKDFFRKGFITLKGISELESRLKKEENANINAATVINGIRAAMAGTTDIIINDSHVKNWFSINGTSNKVDGDDEDNDGVGASGNNGKPGKPGKTATETPTKTKDEVLALTNPLFSTIYAMDEDIILNTTHVPQIVELQTKMLKAILELGNKVTTQHAKQFFNDVKNLFVNYIDPDKVLEKVDDDELAKVYKAFNDVANATKKLTALMESKDIVEEITNDDPLFADKPEVKDEEKPLIISDETFTAVVE